MAVRPRKGVKLINRYDLVYLLALTLIFFTVVLIKS